MKSVRFKTGYSVTVEPPGEGEEDQNEISSTIEVKVGSWGEGIHEEGLC